jgi:hypothetical protein
VERIEAQAVWPVLVRVRQARRGRDDRMTGVVGVRVPVTGGGAKAGGISPSAAVAVTPGGARAGGISPVGTAIIGPGSALVTYVLAVPAPHPHLEANRNDLIAYGLELVVAGVCLYTGSKLVANRTFKL